VTNGLISYPIGNTGTTSTDIGWNELILVLLLLCLSGNSGIVNESRSDIMVALSTVVIGAFCIHKEHLFTDEFVIVSLLFAGILFIQCVSFGFWPLITITGFFCRLFIGNAVVNLVKDFPRKYVTVMFYVAIVSLIFHSLEVLLLVSGFDIIKLFSPISSILDPKKGLHIGVHNYFAYGGTREYFGLDPWRNSSFFWEPGAFAGYLILAIAFLGIVRASLPQRIYRLYFIVLSIALFSTLSTAGYVAYSVALLLYYCRDQRITKKDSIKVAAAAYVILPVLIGSSFVAYNKLPFMKEKIAYQLFTVDVRRAGWHKTRMGSLLLDWEYIKSRPLEGWGLHQTTRYALNPEFLDTPQGMGNGMSDFTAKFGITGMIIWLFFVFRALMYLTRQDLPTSMIGMLAIVLVLQGECFLNYPLFLGLMFLGNGAACFPEARRSGLRGAIRT